MGEKNIFKLDRNFKNAYEDYVDYIFSLFVQSNLAKYDFKRPITFISISNSKALKIKTIELTKFRKDFIETILDNIIVFTTEENEKITLENLVFKYGCDLFQICDTLTQIFTYIIENSMKNQQKMHIDNKTIIITDPCYVVKKEDSTTVDENETNVIEERDVVKENGWDENNLTLEQAYEVRKSNREYHSKQEEYWDECRENYVPTNDWNKCEYGENLPAIGLNGIARSTIYGDWSCTTFNSNTNETIGEFCADAGMVGVFILDEVLAYNPDFKEYLDKKWTTTVIENFTGDVWFEVHHHEGVYEDDTSWHKKGQKWENDSVHVVGKGNINFITEQTGF